MSDPTQSLKPCPYCGSGTDKLHYDHDNSAVWVGCGKCGSRGRYASKQMHMGITSEDLTNAAVAWNRRMPVDG